MFKWFMTSVSLLVVMTIVLLQIQEVWAYIMLALCIGWMWGAWDEVPTSK